MVGGVTQDGTERLVRSRSYRVGHDMALQALESVGCSGGLSCYRRGFVISIVVSHLPEPVVDRLMGEPQCLGDVFQGRAFLSGAKHRRPFKQVQAGTDRGDRFERPQRQFRVLGTPQNGRREF